MNGFLFRNVIRIAAFTMIFLSSGNVFCGNDTIPSAPQTAEEWFNTGYVLYRYGLFEESIEHFEEAIKLKPSFAEACYYLGAAYAEGKQDYEEAIIYYDKTIKLVPNSGYVHFVMGDAYRALGKEKEAIKYYKEAAKLGNELARQLLRDNNISW